MNLISLCKEKKMNLYLKKCCGIRNTVKVAKDTDREEKKKISSTKNARAYNLSFDSRQSNIEEEEHIQ